MSTKPSDVQRIEPKESQPNVCQLHEDLEERLEQRAAILKATNWELRQEVIRRAAIEQLEREERIRFRTLVETIPHGIVEFDLNGIITFANAEFHRIHEFPEGSLIKQCLWDLLKPVFPDAQNDIEKTFRDRPSPATHFYNFQTPTGKCVDLKADWNYKRDAGGNITGLVVVITDVTKQRRAEEQAQQRLNQLAHVSRIFIMNQLVSGLAHELNQPLAAIANFAQVCRHNIAKSSGKERDKLLESIEQIAVQADRAGQIIRRMRDFVRRADSRRSHENLNDLITDVLGLLEIEARTNRIQLETFLATELPKVIVDRIQIEQVITNLVKNAMEAVLDLAPGCRRISLATKINADGLLELSVTDSGKGVDEIEFNRLFESFYTTKHNGMGLGLSISKSIVESHGGHLEAVNNDHIGMTFRFTLPIAIGDRKA